MMRTEDEDGGRGGLIKRKSRRTEKDEKEEEAS